MLTFVVCTVSAAWYNFTGYAKVNINPLHFYQETLFETEFGAFPNLKHIILLHCNLVFS
jgi:hypothetical protein